MKRLIASATLVASLVAMTLPASAGSTTGTVKIQWNVTALLSLSFQGNYTNTGTSGSLNPTPLLIANGGSGACGGAGSAGAGAGTTALTLDYGAITPDAAKVTGCVVPSAAEAVVNTNDSLGVTISEQSSAPSNAAVAICPVAIENNAPVAFSSTGVSSSNFTAAKATDTTDTTATNWAGTTCAGLTYSAASVHSAAITTAATVFKTSDDTTNPAYFGEDYAVLLPANASQTASDSSTITYTVTAN